MLNGSYCHARAGGEQRGVLGPDQILVTAPCNVQVNRLQQRLGKRARVGTVDKFQGQEAPVVIHSLTASDGDAAPRGLGFLLEPNQLNVAISRAQCLSIVVGSPGLTTGIANTVEEAEQINRLCCITQSATTGSPMATMLKSIWLSVAAALSLLSVMGCTALAQQPVQPLPRSGGCPFGYYSSGGYCVPSSGGNTRRAIKKSGSSCPIGFYSSGDYCVSSPNNQREAIQKSGNSCPIGWFSSGSYCVKNR